MHDPAIFNFKPSSLVRISKDDIIDQYQIFPIKIGEGNDAVVYKAKQNFEGGQWRAIKKIHRSYIDKEEYLLTEIDILKRLDHPGVLKIFQVFDDSQYVSIVTQLCEGNCLLQQLKKRGHYSQLQAKQIFRKLLEVVSYCHQNKIIHRDLKFQNLVFCSEKPTPQSLRLIDFGMAFQWKSNPRQEIKNTFESNKVVGTIYYMAPQIRNQTYDHRVDIWSCGVILFTLLTGELPFNQDEDQDILEAIKERKISYQKLKKRKCSNQVIDLLKRIFVSEMKRISIQQIFSHNWLKKTQDQQKIIHNQIQYFSLVPYKQFSHLQQFREYYRQKIQQIAENDNKSSKYTNDNCTQQNKNDCLTVNWNNFYQFLALDQIEKAIKIYLTYRLTHKKSSRYRKIFDKFKTIKKENILLLTLHDLVQRQHQHFLNQLEHNGRSQNIILDQQKHFHHKKRQLSIKQDDNIYSVKKVYSKILSFLQQNKYRTVNYTMFLSWICDYDDLNKEELDFLRNKLRNKFFQDRQKRRDVINEQITNIHKIIRISYLEKKVKNKSQFSYPTSSLDSTPSTQRNNRNIPLLSINVQKIKEGQKTFTKRTAKKSIKQNILESISPTFIRKTHTTQKQCINAIKTDRPMKGNRLLEKNKEESGFLMGIHKIISFF